MVIIENLKLLREKAEYKQFEVAKILGVTQSAVSQWELGLCNPEYKYLSEMANIYNCSLENLIQAINLCEETKPKRDSPDTA